MDAGGDFVVVWKTRPGRHRRRRLRPPVRRRRRCPGGRVPGQHLHRGASASRRWPSTPTATSSSPGRDDQDGSDHGIFARRFDAAGVRQAPSSGSTPTPPATSDPAVAMDADGDFVVAWTSFAQDGAATASSPGGSTPPASPKAASSGSTPTPSPQTLPRGDGRRRRLRRGLAELRPGRRALRRLRPAFDSAGVPQAAEFQVNTYTTSTQAQHGREHGRRRRLRRRLGERRPGRLRLRHLRPAVRRRRRTPGAEFQVNTYTATTQASPPWLGCRRRLRRRLAEHSQDGSGYGVFAQRFAATTPRRHRGTGVGEPDDGLHSGARGRLTRNSADHRRSPGIAPAAPRRRRRPVGGHRRRSGARPGGVQVNSYTRGDQTAPAVATEDNGDFVVVWEAPTTARVGASTRALRAGRAGPARSGQRLRHRQPGPPRRSTSTPTATSSSPGRADQDGSGSGVFARRFTRRRAQAGEFRVNTYTTGTRPSPVAMSTPTATSSSPGRARQDGTDYGVYAQRFNAAGAPAGAEFRVNTYTTDLQPSPPWRWTPTATSSSPGRATARTATA